MKIGKLCKYCERPFIPRGGFEEYCGFICARAHMKTAGPEPQVKLTESSSETSKEVSTDSSTRPPLNIEMRKYSDAHAPFEAEGEF